MSKKAKKCPFNYPDVVPFWVDQEPYGFTPEQEKSVIENGELVGPNPKRSRLEKDTGAGGRPSHVMLALDRAHFFVSLKKHLNTRPRIMYSDRFQWTLAYRNMVEIMAQEVSVAGSHPTIQKKMCDALADVGVALKAHQVETDMAHYSLPWFKVRKHRMEDFNIRMPQYAAKFQLGSVHAVLNEAETRAKALARERNAQAANGGSESDSSKDEDFDEEGAEIKTPDRKKHRERNAKATHQGGAQAMQQDDGEEPPPFEMVIVCEYPCPQDLWTGPKYPSTMTGILCPLDAYEPFCDIFEMSEVPIKFHSGLNVKVWPYGSYHVDDESDEKVLAGDYHGWAKWIDTRNWIDHPRVQKHPMQLSKKLKERVVPTLLTYLEEAKKVRKWRIADMLRTSNTNVGLYERNRNAKYQEEAFKAEHHSALPNISPFDRDVHCYHPHEVIYLSNLALLACIRKTDGLFKFHMWTRHESDVLARAPVWRYAGYHTSDDVINLLVCAIRLMHEVEEKINHGDMEVGQVHWIAKVHSMPNYRYYYNAFPVWRMNVVGVRYAYDWGIRFVRIPDNVFQDLTPEQRAHANDPSQHDSVIYQSHLDVLMRDHITIMASEMRRICEQVLRLPSNMPMDMYYANANGAGAAQE